MRPLKQSIGNIMNIQYTVAINAHNETQAHEFISYLENGLGFDKVASDLCQVVLCLDIDSYNDVMTNDFYHNEYMFEYVTAYLSQLTIATVNKD